MHHHVDWVAVGSLCTAGAAAITGLMAWQTKKLAVATTQLAEDTKAVATATQEAAGATRDDADATLELVRQSRYAMQPVVAVEYDDSAVIADTDTWLVVFFTNIGLGPALECRFALQDNGWWLVTRAVHLSPGAAANPNGVRANYPGTPVNYAWFQRQAGGDPYRAVIFCRDMFDQRYRFPIEHGHVLAPEIRSPVGLEVSPNSWWTDLALWPKGPAEST